MISNLVIGCVVLVGTINLLHVLLAENVVLPNQWMVVRIQWVEVFGGQIIQWVWMILVVIDGVVQVEGCEVDMVEVEVDLEVEVEVDLEVDLEVVVVCVEVGGRLVGKIGNMAIGTARYVVIITLLPEVNAENVKHQDQAGIQAVILILVIVDKHGRAAIGNVLNVMNITLRQELNVASAMPLNLIKQRIELSN